MLPEYKIKFIWNALRGVQHYSLKGEAFVLDLDDVELAYKTISPFIVSWQKSKEDNWSYEPQIPPVMNETYISKSFELFDKK